MRTVPLLLCLALASLSLPAQNWVTNGDFSNALVGWTQTGYAYNPGPETWDVTGRGASACFACSPGGQTNPPPFPPNTLDQSVLLAPGIPYELSADLSCTVVLSPSTVPDLLTVTADVNGVQVGKVTFGSSPSAPLPKEWRARLCARFQTTAAGMQPLSLKFGRNLLATANSMRVRIDNVSLQIASGPTFNVDGPRRINKTSTLVTEGTPGALYAVFLAGGELANGLVLPGVLGTWFLDPLTTTVLLQGQLDVTGRASIGIAVPNDPYLLVAPLFFQPAQIASGVAAIGYHHAAVFTL